MDRDGTSRNTTSDLTNGAVISSLSSLNFLIIYLIFLSLSVSNDINLVLFHNMSSHMSLTIYRMLASAFVAEKFNIQTVFTCDLPLDIISLTVSQKYRLAQCLSRSYLFRVNIVTPNRLAHSILGHMWVVK